MLLTILIAILFVSKFILFAYFAADSIVDIFSHLSPSTTSEEESQAEVAVEPPVSLSSRLFSFVPTDALLGQFYASVKATGAFALSLVMLSGCTVTLQVEVPLLDDVKDYVSTTLSDADTEVKSWSETGVERLERQKRAGSVSQVSKRVHRATYTALFPRGR